MKSFFLFTLALFTFFSAQADCAGTGLSVFPAGGAVKQNTVFLLEGYAESQSVVYGLNTKYPIYLKSGDKKIRLNVKETLVGQFWLSQALLVPETEPEAGLDYTLYIDNLPEYESLGEYDYTTDKARPYIFRIVGEKDLEKPVVTAVPKETGKTCQFYGCGPAMYVSFDVPATDASPMLVKTVVKSVLSGEETTYYLVVTDVISIGHNMCSGAFVFKEDSGDNYEAAFSFMDLSGNLQPWEGPRIQFTRPKPETKELLEK